MKVERGISFKEALQKMNTDYLPGDGFCISNKVHVHRSVGGGGIAEYGGGREINNICGQAYDSREYAPAPFKYIAL